MKTNIGIKEKDTQAVAVILNKLLADEHVLYVKARNAHWNVEGRDFHAQHVFFESIYDQLSETIDEIAERIRSIGHYAVGTMKEFLELTQLSELRHTKNDSLGYIEELLSDFEAIIVYIREQIETVGEKHKDAGTEDFLVAIMEQHEKTAWMLRAHLR
ncbi:starvation-inducible DNA-binding protein [Sphingobacterium allocomposti]|jgi:starvation-inducible DNA-binding protein|uniref:Starvation-inducible DNA-binding protein n=1 Tax=Sphingobacterium allocomposti TaxID=415956 RepID=A0A5S5DM11_9SPHI|nr:DNA starvation/stationary phase protection protein [Sphingobacterium composti Yoo et al. 2007 non Ten et al. 2007]TYP96881.1 starvation-inducible DNA-binding protein [Sphingobacterium composti Yoo et al. 2007 non Ten et al. 2007]HLS94796.1 DNA starvation/stationary phase protection protein [Sphingobacterium sp.]